MKHIILVIVLIFIASCDVSKLNDDLILKIENEQLYSFNLHEEDENDYVPFMNIEKFSKGNKITFTIENRSKSTYFFSPTCPNNIVSGCSFIQTGSNIELSNLIFYKNEDIVDVNYIGFNQHRGKNEMRKDSLMFKQNKKLGYKEDFELTFIFRRMIEEDYLIIPPKSTLFFESYVNLPLNETNNSSKTESVWFKNKNNYSVSLKFVSDTTSRKMYMSNSLIRTIKENGFKVFHGELISNKIPLKFLDIADSTSHR